MRFNVHVQNLSFITAPPENFDLKYVKPLRLKQARIHRVKKHIVFEKNGRLSRNFLIWALKAEHFNHEGPRAITEFNTIATKLFGSSLRIL